MPDKVREIHARRDIPDSVAGETVASASTQVKINTTVVRIAVARLEFKSPTPTLARTAVAPAKSADKRDQKNQFISGCKNLKKLIRDTETPVRDCGLVWA